MWVYPQITSLNNYVLRGLTLQMKPFGTEIATTDTVWRRRGLSHTLRSQGSLRVVVTDNTTLYCQEYLRWGRLILHTVPHPKANGVLAVGLYGLLEKTLKCEEMFVGCSSYHYWKCWLAGHCGGISPPLMRLSWFWPMERELTSAWISLADLLWIITSYYVLKCSLNASEFSSELWYYNFELNALKSSLKRFYWADFCDGGITFFFFIIIKPNNSRVTCCYSLIMCGRGYHVCLNY